MRAALAIAGGRRVARHRAGIATANATAAGRATSRRDPLRAFALVRLAEAEGFEPPTRLRALAFKVQLSGPPEEVLAAQPSRAVQARSRRPGLVAVMVAVASAVAVPGTARPRRWARAISSTWRSPITPRAGGNPPTQRDHLQQTTKSTLPRTTLPGLPLARDVIALREVVEMARPLLPQPRRNWSALPAISETCPPGEGMSTSV